MPSIIITPGTFNPPASPVQSVGIITFPKTPDVTLARRPQQSSRSRVTGFPPLPPLPLPVKYTLVDFLSGDLTVGVDVPSLDMSKSNFTTAGATYVANDLYAITARDGGAKTVSAVGTPIFTLSGGTEINLGTVEIGTGFGAALSFNNFLVRINHTINLTGSSLPFDEVLIPLSTTPAALTGILEMSVLIPGAPHLDGWVDRAFSQNITVIASLKVGGQVVDRVYVLLLITGNIHFVSPAAGRPTITTGLTLTERLYGSAPGAITPPSIPYAGYLRESFASRGTLTLS